MSEYKSPVVRLFVWIWRIFIGLYRAVVVLATLLVLATLWFAFQGGPPVSVENNIALTLIPTGSLSEQVDETSRGLLRTLGETRPSQTLVRDLTDALDAAAADPRIPLAVLKLDDLEGAGLPQLQEIAVAMQKFRAAGKPIYVYGESYDQSQYFLAAHADEVSLDPVGILLLEGYGVYTNYFKDALDKLGVQVNVFRVGQYKSAVEPFLRNDMSEDAKAANRAWLADLWKVYNDGISSARKLPANTADAYVREFAPQLVKHSGDAAAYALDAKLVTRLETLREFRKRVAEKVGYDRDKGSFRQIDFSSYLRAVHREQRHPAAPKIALVVAQGEIVDGESDNDNAGGDTIAALLDSARRDPTVSAVLLRVNSPGGSVNASEKIRQAVVALHEDGKPVVVSMSTVAASGGYWISMGSDRIFAEPSTITGSIGIFGMIPTIDQPLGKLGIHTDGVGTTPLAGALRIDRPLSPDVKAIAQSLVERGYQQFITGVAKSRKLAVDKVDAMARGRVWSGAAARDLGLVDELGGLQDAERAAAQLAKLAPDAYRLEELQPQRETLGRWLGHVLGGSHAGLASLLGALPPQSGLQEPAQAALKVLHTFNDPLGEYAYCFCTPAPLARLR